MISKTGGIRIFDHCFICDEWILGYKDVGRHSDPSVNNTGSYFRAEKKGRGVVACDCGHSYHLRCIQEYTESVQTSTKRNRPIKAVKLSAVDNVNGFNTIKSIVDEIKVKTSKMPVVDNQSDSDVGSSERPLSDYEENIIETDRELYNEGEKKDVNIAYAWLVKLLPIDLPNIKNKEDYTKPSPVSDCTIDKFKKMAASQDFSDSKSLSDIKSEDGVNAELENDDFVSSVIDSLLDDGLSAPGLSVIYEKELAFVDPLFIESDENGVVSQCSLDSESFNGIESENVEKVEKTVAVAIHTARTFYKNNPQQFHDYLEKSLPSNIPRSRIVREVQKGPSEGTLHELYLNNSSLEPNRSYHDILKHRFQVTI